MRAQAIDSLAAWPADLTPPGGVLVLTGYGLDIRVWRGRLRVADGIGRDRREAIIHRATGRLRRLVVLGHTGSISLEAIRWLADVGAGFLQIDADGRVLAAFGPQGTDRPGLRRAQARALDTPLGADLARRLIGEKIAAQSEALAAVGEADVTDRTLATIREAVTRLHVAATRDDVRMAEAMAAAIAARVVGLDPGLGVLHADQTNRDSLAADLMEPIRPLVDRAAFGLLGSRTFAADDFYETAQGICRLTPRLARELAESSGDWTRPVGRVAEDVARLLAAAAGSNDAPTPLTGRRRSAARPGGSRPGSDRGGMPLRRRCTVCGGPSGPDRVTCGAACEQELRDAQEGAFVDAGIEAARKLRASGWRPAMSEEGRARVAAAAAGRVRDARLWQRTNAWPDDLSTFAREIAPLLAAVSAGEIAAATGLSMSYCRRLQRGEVTPHPMWWETLRALGG